MSLLVYNEERHIKCMKKESYEEGRAVGRAIGRVLSLLEGMGDVPPELEERIQKEEDMATLHSWLRTAALSESLEEFLGKTQL